MIINQRTHAGKSMVTGNGNKYINFYSLSTHLVDYGRLVLTPLQPFNFKIFCRKFSLRAGGTGLTRNTGLCDEAPINFTKFKVATTHRMKVSEYGTAQLHVLIYTATIRAQKS